MYEREAQQIIREIEQLEAATAKLNEEYATAYGEMEVIKKQQRDNGRSVSWKKGQLSIYNKIDGTEYLKSRYAPAKDTVPPAARVDKVLSTLSNADKCWSESEDLYIVNNYTKIPTRDMSGVLGRTEGSIRMRASILGVATYRRHRKSI